MFVHPAADIECCFLIANHLIPGGICPLTASKLTVVKRSDGTEQLAYNGWPLYRYAKDAKAGDDTGQAVGGVWYVVDATGNAIK